MKWEESIANTCRYGDIASRLFAGSEIIWEHSESDYQGFANVLVQKPNGQFAHYEWTYGSCSGCDEWEARGLSDEEIVSEMEFHTAWFDNVEELKRYLRLEGEFEHAKFPSANSPTNGSVPGMLYYLSGGIGSDFNAMGQAFLEWEKANG